MSVYDEYKAILETSEKYPTTADLVYKHNFSHMDVFHINEKKFFDPEYVQLSLVSEDGTPLHYWKVDRIVKSFNSIQQLIDNANYKETFNLTKYDNIQNQIISEIEASLAIEGIRCSRMDIERLITVPYEQIESKQERIIKNMLEGFRYIDGKDINETTIYQLYRIITRDVLDKEAELRTGFRYRHDMVEIIRSNQVIKDRGVSHEKIPQMMNKLIQFIHQKRTYEEHLFTPHILHYYLIYIHPYYKYNGHMARILSFWYAMQYIPSFSLLFLSEAINNAVYKSKYYTAISNARESNNDITYFLEYMSDIVLAYSKVYINLFHITSELKGRGKLLNRSTEIALKNVLTMPKIGDGYFDWKDYREFSGDEFSKVQFLKLLNTLVQVGVLKDKEQKKVKLFLLNRNKWSII